MIHKQPARPPRVRPCAGRERIDSNFEGVLEMFRTLSRGALAFPSPRPSPLRGRILRNFSPIEALNQWKTSNIECRRARKFRCSLDVRRWMLDVPGGAWGAATAFWLRVGPMNR